MMKKVCKSDISKHCGAESRALDESGKVLEGTVISCLIKKRSDLTPICAASVLRKEQQRVHHVCPIPPCPTLVLFFFNLSSTAPP